MEKLYKYEIIDTNETIYADSGDEFKRIWDRTHAEEPSGAIKVTTLATGDSGMMYPIKITN